jgi:hypothetical protein
LEGLAAERLDKQKQIAGLNDEIEALKTERLNQQQRVREVVAAAASSPPAARSSALNAAVRAASKSLYSTAIYAFGVDAARYNAAVSAMQKAGYTILKSELLTSRPPWLAEKPTVLYYAQGARQEALSIAELVRNKSGIPTTIAQGAGLGIPQGKESLSFRVHLVRSP